MSDFEEINGKILEETVQHLKTSICALDTLPTCSCQAPPEKGQSG